MVGIVKIWLLRESRGSNSYLLTTDKEYVERFKELHKRHWGSLVWTRSFNETKNYTGEIYMWILKTYLDIHRTRNRLFTLDPRTRWAIDRSDTPRRLKEVFASNGSLYIFSGDPGEKVIGAFRARLKDMEREICIYRDCLRDSKDWDRINLLYSDRWPEVFTEYRGITGTFDDWKYKKEHPEKKKKDTFWSKTGEVLTEIFKAVLEAI